MLQGTRRGLLLDRRLGEDALYRVVDVSGELVVVEVVRAPGLQGGTHIRFTQDAVGHMKVVEEATVTAVPNKDRRAVNTRPR